MAKNLINTIYVMSKGRPDCVTAQMLTDIAYPGEWFIVCGDNDETYGEYVEKWGKGKVLLFDWARYVESTDLLDPFGVENGKPSGAAPARNAIHDISQKRGEKRHWQLDDDFPIFYDTDDKTGRKIRIEDGNRLYWYFNRLAEFGEKTGIADVGIGGATLFIDAAAKRKVNRQCFGCHNMPSDDSFYKWRGRMADDICLAIDLAHVSRGIQISFNWFGYPYTPSAKKAGGNTDLYLQDGYIRKAGYANLVNPGVCKVRIDDNGPKVRMTYPNAKIIHERFMKHGYE